MKSQTAIYALIALVTIALGSIWLSYLRQDSAPRQVFPATIHRDCAPWDGTAFAVSISMDESVLTISIYQSPAIQHPAIFSLHEEAGDVGSAFLLSPDGSQEPLTGKVSFQRVEERIPVEGEYHFRTASGKQVTGRFQAEWGNEIVYCG